MPAPAKGVKAKTARGQQKPYDVPNHVLIRRAIKGRKHISLVELRELFTREKRAEKSISPILSRLVEEKLLKQVGGGSYDVLGKPAKKKSVARKAAVAAASAANGSGVTTNG